MCNLRAWISRHPIRFVVYALIVSVAILAAVDVWLLHGRLGGALVVRLAQLPAVRSIVQFRSARVACCETNCRFLAEVDGLTATPPASNGLSLEIGRVRLCNGDTQIENFTLRDAAKRSMVSVASAKLGLAAIPLAVRLDGIALGSNPPLATVGNVDLRTTLGDKEIAIDQTRRTTYRSPDLLVIPNVDRARPCAACRWSRDRRAPDHGSDTTARLERRSDGSWKLPDAAAVQALGSGLQEAYAKCWPTTPKSYLEFVGLRFGSVA